MDLQRRMTCIPNPVIRLVQSQSAESVDGISHARTQICMLLYATCTYPRHHDGAQRLCFDEHQRAQPGLTRLFTSMLAACGL